MGKGHLLKLEGVSKSFGHVKALSGVTLEIDYGTRYGLVGPNGSGKSTLIRIISGVLRPDKGAIYWKQNPVTRISQHNALVDGRATFHQSASLIPTLNARDNLKLGRERVTTELKASFTAAIKECEQKIDFAKDVLELSYPERFYVQLGRLLRWEPNTTITPLINR